MQALVITFLFFELLLAPLIDDFVYKIPNIIRSKQTTNQYTTVKPYTRHAKLSLYTHSCPFIIMDVG